MEGEEGGRKGEKKEASKRGHGEEPYCPTDSGPGPFRRN